MCRGARCSKGAASGRVERAPGETPNLVRPQVTHPAASDRHGRLARPPGRCRPPAQRTTAVREAGGCRPRRKCATRFLLGVTRLPSSPVPPAEECSVPFRAGDGSPAARLRGLGEGLLGRARAPAQDQGASGSFSPRGPRAPNGQGPVLPEPPERPRLSQGPPREQRCRVHGRASRGSTDPEKAGSARCRLSPLRGTRHQPPLLIISARHLPPDPTRGGLAGRRTRGSRGRGGRGTRTAPHTAFPPLCGKSGFPRFADLQSQC